MKHLKLIILLIGIAFISCNENKKPSIISENLTEKNIQLDNSNDKEEIQNLIRKVLNWSFSKEAIDYLPALADKKDSVYVGFDIPKHNANLSKLKETNLFGKEFIENYNQIILTLDRKLKNREFDEWLVGDLHTFSFANDVDPWILCQEIPYDSPKPWDFVEVKILNLKKGEVIWTWGNLPKDSDKGWKDFYYEFRVAKEDNKWKIAYLKGFDFKESIQKD